MAVAAVYDRRMNCRASVPDAVAFDTNALQFQSPSTSCIEYSFGGLPTIHFAARNAPLAKISRLAARCVSSSRSPGPLKYDAVLTDDVAFAN